ncbi:penicillin-binding transpeptidase domain-containing protein [Alkalihalobacillus sp. LMS39]|uniref:penicillin-binding transpeptidase domain-containing protein n=1 Tax=Alkalihalobacillus sp. LMS39 TaxID=2924032 RepID=UPI001FB1B6AC|nr:penicillin-binding transpeptidase domain-containing protein [Alkalihalobacillus sp. LMS39]UOE95423.1 penicillin-binding transpeptidase domain-containing protein [Alkalihalobacillus sp. LMS39]
MRKLFKLLPLLVIFLLMSACSEKEPLPEEALQSYLSFVEQGDYEKMYEYLTTSAKEKISKEEFVERYTNIYGGMEVESIEIDYSIPEEEVEREEDVTEVTLQYAQKMDTIAGEISFSPEVVVVLEENEEEEKEWKIEWTPSLLVEGLEENERIRVQTSHPTRGEILDRNGEPLAANGSIYEIGIVPGRMEGQEETSIAALSAELNMAEEEIEKKLDQSWVGPDTFVPIVSVPITEQPLVQRLYDEIPGATYREASGRVYPLGEAAAHLTGYISLITAEQLDELEGEGYDAHSYLGQAGLERVLEDRLKGERGAVINIEDENGEMKKVIADKEAVDGESIMLAIDSSLQQTIYEQYEENGDAGTAVAMHPTTGEVLSLVSSPAYDPNEFILGLSSYQDWSEDERKPLLNRFTQTYAPGSTIKPITAAIALDNGWNPTEKREIVGERWKPDASDWGDYTVRRVNGNIEQVDLKDALVYSDNIYFAQMALDLGIDSFKEGLEAFGFTESIPFGYGMGTSSWANEDISSGVQLVDTSYGQGQMLVNPLHLATMYTTFLNSGTMLKPQLYEGESEPWKENIISAELANEILESLIEVVESPNGTGREAQISNRVLAGKTGTTEYKESQGDEGEEFGWFIGVDTTSKDLLVLMVVEGVEDRGGSSYVVPKVRDVFLSK